METEPSTSTRPFQEQSEVVWMLASAVMQARLPYNNFSHGVVASKPCMVRVTSAIRPYG